MDKKEFLPLDKYEKQIRIGYGGFGEVFKVLEKSTGKIFAAKISVIEITEDQKSLVIELRHEINILSQSNHPSILKFIGYSPINFIGEPKPVIVAEFASNGSLKDLLDLERKSEQPASWNSTKKLINIYGIASAMSYLHSHNIIHRDLKTGNILEDENLYPKLADFGLSKIYHQSETSMSAQSTKDLKGTPKYVAPESWEKYEYTKEGDVYSFSFIVYQILTLEEPFKNYNIQMLYLQVVKQGYRPEFNKPIADSYRQLITQCWANKPADRPTFSEIVTRLKSDPKFITDEVDKDEYMNYIKFIDNYHTTYDPGKKFDQITVSAINPAKNSGEKEETKNEEDDEQERFKRAFREMNQNKKEMSESSSSSISSSIDDFHSKSGKEQKFIFDEISKMKEFGSLPEETQEFLKHTLSSQSTTNKTLTIPTNKTVLLFADESFTSPDFITILKYFESITIEVKCPSNVFDQILKALSNLNITTYKVHLIISEKSDLKASIQNFTAPIVATFDSSKITEISECALERCASLTEVTIPSSVTSIGNSAFSGCSKLAHVTIPSSVTSLGSYAFSGCSKLAEITIPSSVVEIGEGTFCFCSKLNKLTIPSSVKKFNGSVCKGCSLLTEFVFQSPSSIEQIGSECFKDCSKLSSISIPPSVRVINTSAFSGCASLAEVAIPAAVPRIEKCSFMGCSNLAKVTFEGPSSLFLIGEKAFCDCSLLAEFSVPPSVSDIEGKAFEGCKMLKKIAIPSSFKKIFLTRHLGIDKNVEVIKV